MACKNICKLCDRLVVSTSVSYASGVLTVNIPSGVYVDGEKYCLVIAQAIPDTAIINAPVVITIGTGSVAYALMDVNCRNVVAGSLRTRTRYSTRLVTSATGGTFRLLGRLCNPNGNYLKTIS